MALGVCHKPVTDLCRASYQELQLGSSAKQTGELLQVQSKLRDCAPNRTRAGAIGNRREPVGGRVAARSTMVQQLAGIDATLR